MGWNLKKQKFQVTEIPEAFSEIEFASDGSPIFDEEHIPFIQQELDRIKEGYWFMNNGVATYITGLHYFYLNYWTLEDGTVPDYRDCDRRYFYFQDYCEKDPDIFGIIRTKKRREGATSQATADLVKTAITTVKARCGIVSKSGKDATKAFSDMIKPGFKSMPVFLKPVLEDDSSKTELVFLPPKNKKKGIDRKKGQLYDDSVGIGSRIDFMNTVMNAYDSGRLTKIMIDEAGKFPTDVPINEYWPVVKQTLRQGGIKVGFALIPSTSNQLEKGGRGYKVLWDDSNHFDKKETGSGLYRYFNDAADGYIPYIDEYGMSIWDKPTKEQVAWMKLKYKATDLQCSMSVVDWLKYEHDLIKDEAGRNAFKRMFPRTEKDAFDFADNSNIYDMNKIFDQKEYLLGSDIKLRKVRFYRTHEGKVDFVDDENGLWSILMLPEESERNQTVEIGGRIRPAHRSKYFISIDPYKNTLLVGKGSKAGAFVWAKSNPLDPENTGFPIAMYHGRPKLKSIFHNDMLMAAEFYSCECCYESDYDEFIEHFQREKKLHFTMDRPKNSIDPNRKSRASDSYKGVKSADGFSYSMMIDRSVEFVLQRCNKIYFMELLNELEEYDVKERTNYDLAVAFQVGCLVMADPIKKTTPILKVSSMIETFDLTKSSR